MTHKTVLVVDDDRMIRHLAAATLGRHGFLVLEAEGGEQAIHTMRVVAIDLVLLDISMPEMDGIEVLTRLKADSSMADAKVAMLTGSSTPDDLNRALAAGADSYISKPFHPAELLSTVRDLL